MKVLRNLIASPLRTSKLSIESYHTLTIAFDRRSVIHHWSPHLIISCGHFTSRFIVSSTFVMETLQFIWYWAGHSRRFCCFILGSSWSFLESFGVVKEVNWLGNTHMNFAANGGGTLAENNYFPSIFFKKPPSRIHAFQTIGWSFIHDPKSLCFSLSHLLWQVECPSLSSCYIGEIVLTTAKFCFCSHTSEGIQRISFVWARF